MSKSEEYLDEPSTKGNKSNCSESAMKTNTNIFGVGLLLLIVALGGLFYAIYLFVAQDNVTPATGGIWIFMVVGALGLAMAFLGNSKNVKCASKQEKKIESD